MNFPAKSSKVKPLPTADDFVALTTSPEETSEDREKLALVEAETKDLNTSTLPPAVTLTEVIIQPTTSATPPSPTTLLIRSRSPSFTSSDSFDDFPPEETKPQTFLRSNTGKLAILACIAGIVLCTFFPPATVFVAGLLLHTTGTLALLGAGALITTCTGVVGAAMGLIADIFGDRKRKTTRPLSSKVNSTETTLTREGVTNDVIPTPTCTTAALNLRLAAAAPTKSDTLKTPLMATSDSTKNNPEIVPDFLKPGTPIRQRPLHTRVDRSVPRRSSVRHSITTTNIESPATENKRKMF
jgi:hypothetical protein